MNLWMSRWWCFLVLPACSSPVMEAEPIGRDPAIEPVRVTRAAPAPCAQSLDLRVGTVTLPAGLCAERSSEGDDVSMSVVDARGEVRARAAMLAHGAVGDACAADVVGVEERRIRGRRARVCTRTNGRRCYSVAPLVNLCAATASDAALVDNLVATMVR